MSRRAAFMWSCAAIALVGFPLERASGSEHAALSDSPVVWIDPGPLFQGSDERAMRQALLLCLPGADAILPTGCPRELFADERPARRVWISAFGIDRTEVTREAWGRCVHAGVCPPGRVVRMPSADPGLPMTLPMTGVSWPEAQRYCHFVGGRLPTEAEWERAARGATRRVFPWGDHYNDRLANHGRSGGRPDLVDGFRLAAPVGSFPEGRSATGLLDMAGNVWEWVADYYDPGAYSVPGRVDPHGPELAAERVVRGGSWRSPPHALRVTHRERRNPSEAWADVGLRCAYGR